MDSFNLDLDSVLAAALEFLPSLVLALGIYLVALLASRSVTRLIRRAMERRTVDQEIIVLVQLVARWLILAVGVLIALGTVGIDVGGLIAGLGIAGFTLGFALQDVAKNFVAGILLLIQQPFEIDDAIEVGGYSGRVQDISLRTTELLTWDGRNVLIPNGDVYVKPIVNYSREPYRRLELALSITEGVELVPLTNSVIEALHRVEGMLDNPAPEMVWTSSGATSAELSARYWLDSRAVDMRKSQNQALDLVQRALEKLGVQHSVSAQPIEGM